LRRLAVPPGRVAVTSVFQNRLVKIGDRYAARGHGQPTRLPIGHRYAVT